MQPEDADPFGLLESLRDLRSSTLRPLESGYDALDALVAVCRNTVPAADAAAISYAGHGQVRSTHVTHPAIEVIDRWHNQTGAGPLLDEALAQVDVPYAGHRNVSASGSVNSWLSAGRRPLVRRGPYFEEMARLRPGTLHLVDVAGLPDAVAHALAHPASTRLRPGAALTHDLADAGRGYERFWERVRGADRGRVA